VNSAPAPVAVAEPESPRTIGLEAIDAATTFRLQFEVRYSEVEVIAPVQTVTSGAADTAAVEVLIDPGVVARYVPVPSPFAGATVIVQDPLVEVRIPENL
jgi:hypothetical protein